VIKEGEVISDGDMPMLVGEDVQMEMPKNKDLKGTSTQTSLYRRN